MSKALRRNGYAALLLLSFLSLLPSGQSVAWAQGRDAALSPLDLEHSSRARPSLPRAQNIHDFSGWKVFKGDSGKIRFLYPNNWVEVASPEVSDGKYVLSLESPDRSVTGYLIGFPAWPNSTIASYKDTFSHALNARNEIAAPEDRITLVSERFTRVDGQDMYQGVTKSKPKAGPALNQYTFAVVTNETLYELVLSCKTVEVEQKSPLVVRIGESLRVPSSIVNLETKGVAKKDDGFGDMEDSLDSLFKH